MTRLLAVAHIHLDDDNGNITVQLSEPGRPDSTIRLPAALTMALSCLMRPVVAIIDTLTVPDRIEDGL
jgi:hypothetical protein